MIKNFIFFSIVLIHYGMLAGATKQINAPQSICPNRPMEFSIGLQSNEKVTWQVNHGTITSGKDSGAMVAYFKRLPHGVEQYEIIAQINNSKGDQLAIYTTSVPGVSIDGDIVLHDPYDTGYSHYSNRKIKLSSSYKEADQYKWRNSVYLAASIISGQGTPDITLQIHDLPENTASLAFIVEVYLYKCDEYITSHFIELYVVPNPAFEEIRNLQQSSTFNKIHEQWSFEINGQRSTKDETIKFCSGDPIHLKVPDDRYNPDYIYRWHWMNAYSTGREVTINAMDIFQQISLAIYKNDGTHTYTHNYTETNTNTDEGGIYHKTATMPDGSKKVTISYLDNLTLSPPAGYQWFCNGKAMTELGNHPALVTDKTGYYNLMVQDKNGCTLKLTGKLIIVK